MTRLAAAQAAGDVLNALGVDQSRPIDPFEAIENSGLELRFQPLEDLLGVMLRTGPGGVLINSERPASLQRYTAAHELGHWHLHRADLRLETDETITAYQPHDGRELDAQTFAAHFLMPLELLYPTARRYGIRRGETVRPAQVYQAARDMHVSYEAAVRQLVNTRLVSRDARVELLKARPLRIKQELADGVTPPDTRGDVWLVDHPGQQTSVEAFVGDAIVLRLAEHPSSGFRWCTDPDPASATVRQLRRPPADFDRGRAFDETTAVPAEVIPMPVANVTSEVVTLLRDEVVRAPCEVDVTTVGAPVTRLVAYGAAAPGRESIHLSETRPFQPTERAASLEVSALVRGAPASEFRRRYIQRFLLEEAAARQNDE
ncbi:MAG: ImmA/IrrE family metallo-endopeptidase [Micrococcales bacterium]|nr:ImmA/IrrE family metallo-endopeptidase [Micrococcales bacterium]